MFRKYDHSIIDVCRRLNREYKFPRQQPELTKVEIGQLVQWLEWRLRAGWDPITQIGPYRIQYEKAVREMGCAQVNHYWGTEMIS